MQRPLTASPYLKKNKGKEEILSDATRNGHSVVMETNCTHLILPTDLDLATVPRTIPLLVLSGVLSTSVVNTLAMESA